MRQAAIVLISLLMAAASARAQEPEAEGPPGALAQAGITGSVRAGYWSSTRNQDPEEHLGAGMLWIKATRQLSSRFSFLAEGWTALRGPMDETDATGEVREAFVDVRLGRLDVRVGRQIIAWGRADGVNPTDNLTAEDLTLLVPEDEDARLGGAAVRASYYLGDISITGLWLPEIRGHRFALPPPPAGVRFVRELPEWPGDQWAVRLEQTGRAVDWSLSYFRGLDLAPDVSLEHVPDASPFVRLSHSRVQILGADMTANAGRFGLRAEAAYVDTDDSSSRDRATKHPFFFMVVGGDRTFAEHLNLNVQYLYRFVLDHRPVAVTPSALDTAMATLQATLHSQTERVQHGISFRVAYKWFHETLEAECAAAGYLEPSGVTLRPKLVYELSDHWKALIGAELFRGEASGLFGLLRPNSTAYLEARWSF